MIPNFTDKNILYLLSAKAVIGSNYGISERTTVLGDNTSIMIQANYRGGNFNLRIVNDSLVCNIYYKLTNDPYTMDVVPYFEYISLSARSKDFNRPKGEIISDYIEYLMTFPPIKEWLIWNQIK